LSRRATTLVAIREKHKQQKYKCFSEMSSPSEIPNSFFEDVKELYCLEVNIPDSSAAVETCFRFPFSAVKPPATAAATDERIRLLGSLGPSTPTSSSPGPSTPLSFSPGPSRSAPSLGNAECSNCKFLTVNIKVLAGKIKVLESTLEMEMYPENHTLDSTVVLHELYNDMGEPGLE
ncbi:hypothetical protein Tco_0403947, partial [Tanacetum coccineum]